MTDAETQYRLAMARLASGVCVVSVRQGSLDLAITATSVTSVSVEPPTVLFCVYSEARMAEVVMPGDRWGVSILGPQAGSAADWLASPGRPAVGQLNAVPHHHGEHSGAALLEEAAAWLECETTWTKPAGSHDVVVGRVLDSTIAPGVSGGLIHHHGRILPLT